MFKIAISLRLSDIIKTSWNPLQTYNSNVDLSSRKYQISHSFDTLVLLRSIPSETSILYKLKYFNMIFHLLKYYEDQNLEI